LKLEPWGEEIKCPERKNEPRRKPIAGISAASESGERSTWADAPSEDWAVGGREKIIGPT